MKKALLTILSLTLLLPHHNFAMQEHNKASQEKLKLSVGSNSIYPNLYGTDVQPSTVNHETNEQNTEVTALLEKIKAQEKTIEYTQRQLKQSLAIHAEDKKCCNIIIDYARCVTLLGLCIMAVGLPALLIKTFFDTHKK